MFDTGGNSISACLWLLQHLASGCWTYYVCAGAEVLAGNKVLTHLQGIIVGRGY